MSVNIKLRGKVYEDIESVTLPTEDDSQVTFSLAKPSGFKKGMYLGLIPNPYSTTTVYKFQNTQYSYAIKLQYKLLNPDTCVADKVFKIQKQTSTTIYSSSATSDYELGTFTNTGEWWSSGIILGPNTPSPVTLKLCYAYMMWIKELSTGNIYIYERGSGGGNNWSYTGTYESLGNIRLITAEFASCACNIQPAEEESEAGSKVKITYLYNSCYYAYSSASSSAYVTSASVCPILEVV